MSRMTIREKLARPGTFVWAASFCVAAGLVLIFAPLLGWPRIHLMANITALGSMIAGLWALAAGLLTVHAALMVSQQEASRARRTVAGATLAQVQSAWSYLEEIQASERLTAAITSLEADPINFARGETIGARSLEVYRGHLGNSWLTLQTASPHAFGALPVNIAIATSLYFAKLLNVIGRLNWLNDGSFTSKDFLWIVAIHRSIRQQLDDLSRDRVDFSLQS